MNTVTTGIDKLHLTFKEAISIEEIVTGLFNLTLDQFILVSHNRRKIKWYEKSYYIKTTVGDVLIAIHTGHTSTLCKSHLIQIHGLALSNSSLNALRPLDLSKIIAYTVLNGSISAMDVYIDDTTDASPFNQLLEQALPHNYRRYIRSPMVADRCRQPTYPRIFPPSGIYYGNKSGNSCTVLAYQKHRCPNQRVYETDNMLKYPYVRFELRLRKAIAKKAGMALFQALDTQFDDFTRSEFTMGQAVTALFRKYFNFIDGARTRAKNCNLQPWWEDILQKAELSLY